VSARTYLTSRRMRELEAALSEREHAVIADVDRLGVLSGRQLRALHYANTDAGRRLCRLDLARLVESRCLARLGRRVGGVRAGSEGFVYAMGLTGRRLVDPNRTRWWARTTPGAAFLRHALSLGDLYVGLCAEGQAGRVSLVAFDAEPTCWRRFAGPGGARLVLKPDAYVVIDSGEFEDHFFIEIDCATESAPRIIQKARVYVRYWQSGREEIRLGLFPLVVWVVPTERRQQQLVSALATLDPAVWQLFTVATVAATVPLLTAAAADIGARA